MLRDIQKRLYDTARHYGERLLDRLYGRGWPATLAKHLGLHPPPVLETHTFALPPSASVRLPLRVAFASDFHAGPTTQPTVIEEACRLLREARPDLLLLGGDFVSFDERYLADILPLISTIDAPLGTYAVFGNHDYWADHQYLAHQLAMAHIHLLTNRNQQLPPPYDDIWLCGLDDATDGRPDVDRAFAGAGAHRLVLMHSPESLRDIADIPFTLALCGHTHGGQVAMPNGRPLLVPHGRFCRAFPGGLYHLPQGILLVSRGIGCSVIPIRLFAQPQVLMCVLE